MTTTIETTDALERLEEAEREQTELRQRKHALAAADYRALIGTSSEMSAADGERLKRSMSVLGIDAATARADREAVIEEAALSEKLRAAEAAVATADVPAARREHVERLRAFIIGEIQAVGVDRLGFLHHVAAQITRTIIPKPGEHRLSPEDQKRESLPLKLQEDEWGVEQAHRRAVDQGDRARAQLNDVREANPRLFDGA